MKGTQRRTIRKEKNNSAGFTLIEMIVTVAIIAIFSGVVVTLITTGSSLFRGVSGNTKSQVKAQETLDEIEDLIIDANRSIYYAYGSGTDMGTQITSDIDDSNAASKTLLPAMNTKMAMEPAVMFLMCLTGWEVKENFITVSVSTQRQAAIRKKKMRMAQATIQKISRQWIPVGFLQKAWTMELLYLHQPTMIVVMELFPEAVQIRQKILKN